MKKFLLSLILLCAGVPALVYAATPSRPNILVILVDDMGFSDLSCYGSEIPTPNIDKLAAEGLRFTQFYNTARCCPSRAALLTGLYSHQAGVGHMTNARKDADGQVMPGYSGHLSDDCVTIPEVLGPANYFTAMVGKWHVGQNHGVTPWSRGFDRSLNAPEGGFYYPEAKRAQLFLNGKRLANDDVVLPAHWYTTDLWTEFSLRFIDDAEKTKKPFFLYLAYNAPHFPLQAPDEDIARYRGKYKAGWDKLREARYQRQIKLGLIDRNWPLAPRPPQVPAWDSLSPEQQDRYDHIMAIYAAVMDHLDHSIGVLIEGLRKRGVLDNTLILFMSDNGGNAESGVEGRLNGDHPGQVNSTVFVGECWAMLNNTPFRRYKHYNHEGGIATPLIAHWPIGIPNNRQGQLESQPGHLIDIMATCVDLAGANYPAAFKGNPIQPMEGHSLVPVFAGKPVEPRTLFFEHEGNAAVRRGDWKLVRFEYRGAWELYDLKTDRTEQHDLALTRPELAQELAGLWNSWAQRAKVLPVQTMKFDKN